MEKTNTTDVPTKTFSNIILMPGWQAIFYQIEAAATEGVEVAGIRREAEEGEFSIPVGAVEMSIKSTGDCRPFVQAVQENIAAALRG